MGESLICWLWLWPALKMTTRSIIQGWVHFTEWTVRPRAMCCLAYSSHLFHKDVFGSCHFTDEKMEAWRAGHTWQLFSCRNYERWGLQPSAANFSQILFLPFELPKGSILRSKWRTSQEVCACKWLWPWDGCVHMDWETRGAGKCGENQNKRVLLYCPCLSGLTLVTQGWSALVMSHGGSIQNTGGSGEYTQWADKW